MDTRDNYISELWMKHMTDGYELKILQQYLKGNSFPRIAILKLGKGSQHSYQHFYCDFKINVCLLSLVLFYFIFRFCFSFVLFV